MQVFNVTYFDGKSSTPFNATLYLLDTVWKIEFLDENQVSQQVVWAIQNIHPAQLSPSSVLIKYGNYPEQTIECFDRLLLGSIRSTYPHATIVAEKQPFLLSPGIKTVAVLFLLLIALVILISAYILPTAAVVIATTIPKNVEEQMGESLFSMYTKENKQLDSATFYANAFAQQLNLNTTYSIQVTVVNSDETNAFALPGGHVVVYSHLLKQLKTPEEFAALIGHEVTHINKQHTLKLLSRNLSSYVFISFLFGDVNGVLDLVLRNANELNNLSYNRNLEQEADDEALALLQQNQLSQRGLLDLLQVLQAESKDVSIKELQYLSTHPLTEERIANCKQRSKSYTVVSNEKIERLFSNIQNHLK